MGLLREITEALEARLDTNWTTTKIQWPNTVLSKANRGNAWVQPWVRVENEEQETLVGDDSETGDLIEGSFVIQVFVRAGQTGSGVIDGYMDTLHALYLKQDLTLDSGGRLCCLVPRRILVGNDPTGDWFQKNLEVPFTHSVPA